jgi:hypothetical protein
MPEMDKRKEFVELQEAIYEQSLVFLALRTRPGYEAKLAETRERIMRIYSRIQTLI